eukprot:2162711-Prymnesium_polylepis.1
MAKRPLPRGAAAAAKKRLVAPTDVVVLEGVHMTKTLLLTSEDAWAAVLSQNLAGGDATVVTLHTDSKPKGLPRKLHHAGAAFDDSQSFEDSALAMHLDSMAERIEAARCSRVVFMCQAGVNRSTLALCYYCAKHGSCSWWRAKDAL